MLITPQEIREFAAAYTEAWCSRSGEKVSLFFSEDATSIINKGAPTVGRAAIADAMGAFFIEFPDLVLHMDDLRTGGQQAVFLWTLEGRNSETGNFVRIPGWQNWVLSNDLLIIEADGAYDVEEYERQVRDGV